MKLTNRAGERASEVQRSTAAAWYMAVCFTICLAGAVWIASSIGVVDFGTSGASKQIDKLVAKDAARKAAAQQAQARQSAEEEARNIAEDSTRLVKAPGFTPPTDPAANAPVTAAAPQPVPAATAKATPQ